MPDKAFVVKNGLIVQANLIYANSGQVGVNTITPGANLDIVGTANVSGAVALANTIIVTGNATLSNTIVVTGNATFSNTIVVTGNATFSNSSIYTGKATFSNTIVVTGNATFSNLVISANGFYTNSTTRADFASGTQMSFQQNTAPIGWTKSTTYDDVGMRVVSGNANTTSGAAAFSSVFSQANTASTTLTTAQMPTHSHTDAGHAHDATGNLGGASGYSDSAPISAAQPVGVYESIQITTGYASIQDTGGGGGHTHALNMQMNYVDFILASKN